MYNLFLPHVALAYLSLIFLLTRGILASRQIDWRQYKLLKIAPHIIDTLLLLSGIALFITTGYSLNSWILAKILFLILYIIFAAKAFKKTQPFSLKHFILAVVSFMMILIVATVK